MKVSTFYTFLITVSLMLPAMDLPAQVGTERFFEQTAGPTGGGRYLSAGHDGVLFAGAPYQFYRSTDNGISWVRTFRKQSADTDLFSYPRFFPQKSATVFATMWSGPSSSGNYGESELYRSRDNGASWERLAGFPSVGIISGVSMAADGSYILVADSGIYRQDTEQSGWEKIYSTASPGVRSWTVGSGRTDQGEIYRVDLVRRPDASTFNIAFRSLDDGRSWQQVGDTIPRANASVPSISRLLVTPDGELFLAHYAPSADVLRLAPGGATWEPVMNGLPPNTRFYDLVWGRTGRLYLIAPTLGVYASSDRGENWRALANGSLRRPSELAEGEDGAILVATLSTIYRSNDGGLSWRESNSGMILTHSNRITIARDGMAMTGVGDLLYITTDEGASWRTSGPPLPVGTQITVIEVDSSDRIYVASSYNQASSSTPSIVARSDDRGENWQTITAGFTATATWDIGIKGDYLFAATDTGIYRSSNRGESWEPANNGLPTMKLRSLRVLRNGDILVGTVENGIWRSRDNGESWQDANEGLSTANIWYIAESPTGSLFALPGDREEGLYRSTDQGNSWTGIFGALPPGARLNSLVANSRGDLFAGINLPSGVRDVVGRSTDGGTTWTIIDTLPVARLAVDARERVWVATSGEGVWRSRSTTSRVIQERAGASKLNLKIEGAAPRFTLHYTLPCTAPATIMLFDRLGRQLRSVAGLEASAGRHAIPLDVDGISSGIYYLHLVQGERSETIPIIITR